MVPVHAGDLGARKRKSDRPLAESLSRTAKLNVWRIGDMLKTHRFQNGEDMEQTLLRYGQLYNQ